VGKRECEFEFDVLKAVGNGHVDDDLRRHVASCGSCAELLEVATAVVDDRRALIQNARVPGSGLVYWRANLRAQQEARRVAVRTATLIQAALVAAAIVIAVVVKGASLPAINFSPILTVPIFAFTAWLILAPVAVYFAVTED